MFKKVSIDNFRGIKKLSVEDLNQINLITSKSGGGKTTFIESLFIMTSPGNGNIPVNINKLRDYTLTEDLCWKSYFNNLDMKNPIFFITEHSLEKESRQLKITPMALTFNVKETDEKKLVTNRTFVQGLNLKFKTKKEGDKAIKEVNGGVRNNNGKVEVFTPQNYNESLPSFFLNPINLKLNLLNKMNTVQQKKQMNRVIKILQLIEPNLKEILIGADGFVYCDIGAEMLFPINLLGYGLYNCFAIIISIMNMPNGYIFIDGIEDGLNNISMEVLWMAIFKFAKELNVQVFATTNSIECIRAFSSAYTKSKNVSDDIRVVKIEKTDTLHKATVYNKKKLEMTLNTDWKVK